MLRPGAASCEELGLAIRIEIAGLRFGVLGGLPASSGLLGGLLGAFVGRRGPLEVVLPDCEGVVLVFWIEGKDGTLGAELAGPPRFGWLARDFTLLLALLSEPRAISLIAPLICSGSASF